MSAAEPKHRKRKRRWFRYVMPTVIRSGDGTPTVTLKTTWAPVALKPVVIWDLDGNARLLSYEMMFAPHRGAPHRMFQFFGIWLSWRLRRLAGWRHWSAINDVAQLACLTPYRVRDACREARRLPITNAAEWLHFSPLERLFLSCQLLPRGHQYREVPVPGDTNPIDLHRFALRLLEDARFREEVTGDQYLVPDEVGKIIHRPTSWLSKARVTGEGPPFIRCGRKILYRRSGVESWLKSREMHSTRAAA